jgi:hypothetical protein
LIQEAHFTLTELPGTLAVWASGIALGLAISRRVLRTAAGPVALMAALASLAMLGDAYDWPGSLKLAIDAVFLVAAIGVAAVLWSGPAPHGEQQPAR